MLKRKVLPKTDITKYVNEKIYDESQLYKFINEFSSYLLYADIQTKSIFGYRRIL